MQRIYDAARSGRGGGGAGPEATGARSLRNGTVRSGQGKHGEVAAQTIAGCSGTCDWSRLSSKAQSPLPQAIPFPERP